MLEQGDIEINPSNIQNLEVITEQGDLPPPQSGEHQLENGTAYWFTGFVDSPYSLRLAETSPLLGSSGGLDGFIHTGGADAIRGSDVNLFQDSMYTHAPGGTILDLSGTHENEMLVQSCAYSDAAGIGEIASLGTISGSRVPTFKTCSFEHFQGGFTFDGSPDKIYIEGSPVRSITASGVTVFTIADTCTTSIIDFSNNYYKEVQSDTEIVRVEPGANIQEVFQYTGNTHDTSVSVNNILNGQADAGQEPYWVRSSHPLRDSTVIGEISLDSTTTTTISSADSWAAISGATTLGNESERVTEQDDGVLEYLGSKRTNVSVTFQSSFFGANGDTYQVGVFKNGTVEPSSTMQSEARGSQVAVSLGTSSIDDLSNGDTISVRVKNLDNANDATFLAYNLNFLG